MKKALDSATGKIIGFKADFSVRRPLQSDGLLNFGYFKNNISRYMKFLYTQVD